MEKLPADEPLPQRLHEAASLLARLLMEDIERPERGRDSSQAGSQLGSYCVRARPSDAPRSQEREAAFR